VKQRLRPGLYQKSKQNQKTKKKKKKREVKGWSLKRSRHEKEEKVLNKNGQRKVRSRETLKLGRGRGSKRPKET